MKRPALVLTLVALLMGGAAYSHHLTRLVSADSTESLSCSTVAAFDCARNLRSEYGKVAGIPVSVFATGFFALVLFHVAASLLVRRDADRRRLFAVPLLMSYMAAVVVAYFLGISIFVLHSICLRCAVVYGIVGLMLIVCRLGLGDSLWRQKDSLKQELRRARPLLLPGAAAVFCGFLSLGSSTEPNPASAAPSMDAPAPTSVAFAGRAQPPVTVVEFADFECPACKIAFGQMEKLRAELPGRVDVQFVNYPLCSECNPDVPMTIHPGACLAAKTGIVMKARGKFDAYCREVFAQQAPLDQALLDVIVERLGEAPEGVRRDAASSEVAEQLRHDVEAGRRANITSTPTMIVSGSTFTGTGGVAQIKGMLASGAQFSETPPGAEVASRGTNASVFIATNGNDANACSTQALPCLTLDAAYRKAQPGQTVEMAAGTYGAQTINADSSKTVNNPVIIRPAAGATVNLGDLVVNGATHLELQSAAVTSFVVHMNSNFVTLRSVDVRGYLGYDGGSNISMIGGSVGPMVDAHPQIAPANGWQGQGQNFIFDGVRFHDMTRTNTNVHTECLQVAGTTNMVIRNSRFTNCAVFDLSFTEYNSSGKVTNLLLENNFFDAAASDGFFSVNISQVSGVTARFNSAAQGWVVQGTNSGPLVFTGNIVSSGILDGSTGGCISSATYSYNVTPGQKCGSTDVNADPLFTNAAASNLHLNSGSPAINLIPISAGGPATDIDGETRPAGAGYDAGADETGSVPNPGGLTANLWIDTNGGSCARAATAATYVDATACSSIQAALAAASPGDTVRMKAGTYAAQAITASKASPGVTVVGEDGTTIGDLSTGGAWYTLQNIVVDVGNGHAPGGWGSSGSNVTLNNLKLHGPYVSVFIGGGSNVTWKGGELGAAATVGGKRIVGCTTTGDAEPVTIQNADHVTFDGITFNPQDADLTPVSCSSNGFHLEMIRLDANTTFFALRNSTFVSGSHEGTSQVFITTPQPGTNMPHDLTFENNFFGTSDASSGSFNVHQNVTTCQNFTIAYNTLLSGFGAFQCANVSNTRWIGNVGTMTSFTPCVGTHTKNVWQDSQTFTCGTDKVVIGPRFSTSALGLGGADGFHLQAGSPAIDAAEASGYCTTTLGGKDINGTARPQGAACDAGAHELAASPPPPANPYAQWANGPSSDPNYFPIGVWLQSPSHISEFKNIGVNTFIGFFGDLDQTGLSQFASGQMPLLVAQNPVGLTSAQRTWIKGWTQMDEPDNAQPNDSGGFDPCITPSTLVTNYNTIRASDTTRPVFLNFGRGASDVNWTGRGTCTGNTAYYTQAAAAGDILSFDIYPVADYSGQLELVAKGIDNLKSWSNNQKIIWNFIEASAFDGATIPTAAQIKAEVWMSLIHGSRGIGYFVHQFSPTFREDGIFNYPAIVTAVTGINAQIAALAPVLNSATVSGAATVASSPSTVPVDIMIKQSGGAIYVFAVAMRNTAASATFMLNGVASGTVDVIGESRQLNVSAGKFTDAFSGYGVHLYKVTAAAADTQAPTVPAGLTATAVSSSQINLAWTASTDNTGVAGYKIFRGGAQIASVTSGTTYQNTGLSASTAYSYTVAAYDAAGNTSAQSTAASATTSAGTGATANIWIDTNGGSCVRSATRTTYTDATACGSMAAARAVAQPGDLILIQSGTYPEQTVAVKNTGATITFQSAPGATVNTGGLELSDSSGLTIIGDPVHPLSAKGIDIQRASNLNLQYVWSHDTTGPGVFIGASQNLTFRNMEVGPLDPNDGWQIYPSSSGHNSNILIEDLFEHDLTYVTDTSSHQDCMDVQDVDGLTVRRAKFYNVGTQGSIYAGTFADGITQNITLEDSFCGPAQNGFYSLQVGTPARNITLRNNTFTQGVSIRDPNLNVQLIGNIFAGWEGNEFSCNAAMSNATAVKYNVFDVAGCSSDPTNKADVNILASLVNPHPATAAAFDLHLKAGASAIDMPGFTVATGAASADYDKQARPFGSFADAGADEFGSGNPPPDTQAPSVPANLTATAAGSTQINLSWTASTDNVAVAGYRVFRGGTLIATVTSGTAYQNTGLTPSTTYSYTVAAFDAAGNASAQSVAKSATTPAAPPPSGPAAWWRFDETSGTTAADSSGNNNTATVTNGTWVVGKAKGALSFNGTTSFAQAASSATLNITGNGTVEAWTKPAAFNTWRSVVAKGSVNNTNAHNYALEWQNDNTLIGSIGNGTFANTVVSGPVTDSNWHHVAFTWDGTNLKLYLDGQLAASVPQTLTPAANTAAVLIGKYGGNVDFFSGLIDEVRIYNRALSLSEVQGDMNAGVNANHPPVVMSPAAPTANPANVGQSVTFSVSATDADGDALTTVWDFGDDTGASGNSVTHTYTAPGTYLVVVTVTDSHGASATSSVTMTVNAVMTTLKAINSGGSAAGTFAADGNFTGGHAYSTSTAISTTGVVRPAPQDVYRSERYGDFSYSVPGLNPGATYTVRLHFAEIYWSAAGNRVFNVAINGTQVLSGFDIYAAAGGKFKAIIKEFPAAADAAGKITIQYSTIKDNAKSSGIEIVSGGSPVALQAEAAAEAPDQPIDLGHVKLGQRFSIPLEKPTDQKKIRLKWTATSRKALPKGVSARNGVVAGKARTAGTFIFELKIQAKAETVTNAYVLTVEP